MKKSRTQKRRKRSQKKHTRSNRRLRSSRVLFRPRYITKYIKLSVLRRMRGGGNFWDGNCEPEPALTAEMVRSDAYKHDIFNNVLDNSFTLEFYDDHASGSYNTVFRGECNDQIYAFRRSNETLPDDPDKRQEVLQKFYDELLVSAELSGLDLLPNIYMAGVYREGDENNANDYTFQVMELITPFNDAFNQIQGLSEDDIEDDIEDVNVAKPVLIRELFERAFDLYDAVAKETPYTFLDLKTGNLAVRIEPTTGNYQVLMIDADPQFVIKNDEMEAAARQTGAFDYYGTNESDEEILKKIKSRIMSYLFATAIYASWYNGADNLLRKMVVAYPEAVALVKSHINCGSSTVNAEKHSVIAPMHTYLYAHNEQYSSIYDAYVLGPGRMPLQKHRDFSSEGILMGDAN